MSTTAQTITAEQLAELKEKAQECQAIGKWYSLHSLTSFPEHAADEEFVLAASPSTVLALIATIEQQRAELDLCTAYADDCERRADNAGRNASAFEDRMGDLQVANGKLADEVERLRKLFAECAEYLNINKYTSIGHGSILHRKMIEAAMEATQCTSTDTTGSTPEA